MNNNKTYIHGAVLPVGVLANLHDSQAGSGKHRCPTCAYEHGFFSEAQKNGNHLMNIVKQ